jgi:hypothetical protein
LLQPHQIALDSMDVIHVHVIIAALQPLLDKDNDESNDPTGLTTCHLKYRSRKSPCLHLSSKLAFNLSHSGNIVTLADVFFSSREPASPIKEALPRTRQEIPHPGTWEAIPKAEWALHRQTSSIQIDPRFKTSLAFPFPDSGRRLIELGNFDKCLPSCVAITEAL